MYLPNCSDALNVGAGNISDFIGRKNFDEMVQKFVVKLTIARSQKMT